MKNLLISALVVGALVCPVVYADDTMGSTAAPASAETVAPAPAAAEAHVVPAPADVKPAEKAKKVAKKSKKQRRSAISKKHKKSVTAVEKQINQETELNNH